MTYSYVEFEILLKLGKTTFTTNFYFANLTAFGEETMMNYDDTFNIFFGTTDKTLDWFDNPFIQMNVYDFDQTYKPKFSNVKL